jgi:hypothetical protein
MVLRGSSREASDEAKVWAVMLTRLAGGPVREDLANGSSFG